jgi:hypothetical protein
MNMGTVIAERVLTMKGTSNKVIVKVGKPRKTANNDFITPYKVLGVGDEKLRFAAGLDAIQSLQLAFQMIGADLYASSRKFKWGDGKDSGFPSP